MRRFKITIVLALCAIAANAQNKKEGENVKSVEITVVDRYKANVKAATKMAEQPSFDDTTTHKLPVNYSITSKMLMFQYKPEPIKPVRVSGVRLGKLPQNYIRLGAGNYGSALAEVILSNSRSRGFNWDVRLRHFSSQKGVKNIAYDKSPFMENEFALGGRWVLKNYRVKAIAGIDWNSNSYYGIPDTLSDAAFNYPSEIEKNAYQRYHANVEFDRIFKRKKSIFKNAAIGYHYFTNNWQTSEQNLTVKSNWTLPKEIENHLIDAGLNVEWQKTNMGVTMQDWSQLNVQFFPKAVGHYKRISYTLGLNFNFFNTAKTVAGADNSNFATYFFPHLMVETELVRDLLFVFGGWTGDVEMQGIYQLTKQNPFMLPEVGNLAPNAQHRIFAGVEGAVAKNISYKLQGGINYVRSMPLFFRSADLVTIPFDDTHLAAFNVAYAQGNYLNLRGELGYNHKNTSITAWGEFFDYTLKLSNSGDLPNPYHLPTLKIGAQIEQIVKDKFVVEAGAVYIAGRKALANDGAIYQAKMDNIIDVNLGVTYNVNKNLGATLKFANLLSQDYELWLGYPAQRFRVMFSLMYNF